MTKQEKILKRALEMAAEQLNDVIGNCPYDHEGWDCDNYHNCDLRIVPKCWEKYFINKVKAKEELK